MIKMIVISLIKMIHSTRIKYLNEILQTSKHQILRSWKSDLSPRQMILVWCLGGTLEALRLKMTAKCLASLEVSFCFSLPFCKRMLLEFAKVFLLQMCSHELCFAAPALQRHWSLFNLPIHLMPKVVISPEGDLGKES